MHSRNSVRLVNTHPLPGFVGSRRTLYQRDFYKPCKCSGFRVSSTAKCVAKLLVFPQSIWAHQVGESGICFAPKLTNGNRTPSMSTYEQSVNPSENKYLYMQSEMRSCIIIRIYDSTIQLPKKQSQNIRTINQMGRARALHHLPRLISLNRSSLISSSLLRFRFQVSSFGFQVSGFKFWVSGFGSGFGFLVSGGGSDDHSAPIPSGGAHLGTLVK